MVENSLSAIFISLLSIFGSSFFSNDNPPSAPQNDGLNLIEDFANEARKVVEEVRSAMPFKGANSTLLIELGAKGQLIAGIIGKKCRQNGGDGMIRQNNSFIYSYHYHISILDSTIGVAISAIVPKIFNIRARWKKFNKL